MQDFAAKKKERWIIVSLRKHTLCALVGARVLKKRECQFKLQEWGERLYNQPQLSFAQANNSNLSRISFFKRV